MNVIVICIYNREKNLKRWFHCWQQCVQRAQLVIIHADHGQPFDVPDGVTYIRVPNVGYDIGKMQDIFTGRMPGFPQWENILFLTDDVMPMSKDFSKPFFDLLDDPAVGVSCMAISPYVRRHIRTNGFAIKKEVAMRLVFPADPMITKDDSFAFEHMPPRLADKYPGYKALLDQVEAMGYKVVQVAPDLKSPLFDFEYGRRLRQREPDHYRIFGR